MARLINYVRWSAIASLAIGLVSAVVLAVLVSPLPALGAALSSLLTGAVLYLGAETADAVQRIERKLDRIQARMDNDDGTRQRIAQLQTENAELRDVAEAALNQRDAVL